MHNPTPTQNQPFSLNHLSYFCPPMSNRWKVVGSIALIAIGVVGLVYKNRARILSLWPSSKKPEKENKPTSSTEIPTVSSSLKPGFFVDVLNAQKYMLNGKVVQLPPAGEPSLFTSSEPFEQKLSALRKEHNISPGKKNVIQVIDKTTEQAINDSKATVIITLNFANAESIGGGPGFYKNASSNTFVYECESAHAQEESLCQRSDLMVSLTKLSDQTQRNYAHPLDSTTTAYVSKNSLFAVQANSREYIPSTYLENPKTVFFITSAAQYYKGRKEKLDCSKNSVAYVDAKKRIETHLLASAEQAGAAKKQNASNQTELILGAFGCGAFAPTREKGGDDYRAMIADIYNELLPACKGFFDTITFAVPTLGQTDLLHAAVANHNIFKERLSKDELKEDYDFGNYRAMIHDLYNKELSEELLDKTTSKAGNDDSVPPLSRNNSGTIETVRPILTPPHYKS